LKAHQNTTSTLSYTSFHESVLALRGAIVQQLFKEIYPLMPVVARLVSLAFVLSLVSSFAVAAQPAEGGFTLQQVMSAPFNSDLIAAPSRNRLAWLSNVEGRRNIWVASPTGDGSSYVSRQITQYPDDDGQEISDLKWSPDAESIVYVRGGDTDDPEKLSPNFSARR
jgi:hypothetical protein